MTTIATRLRDASAATWSTDGLHLSAAECGLIAAERDAWAKLAPLVGDVVKRLKLHERHDLYAAYHGMVIAAAKVESKRSCNHEWGTDGAHSNEYCKRCLINRESAEANP